MCATPALRGTTRGAPVQPIQDLVTLKDISVSVGKSGPVKSVSIVPHGPSLDFKEEGDRVSFVVPEVHGHQMIEVAYGG
jgi:hypothetical protein